MEVDFFSSELKLPPEFKESLQKDMKVNEQGIITAIDDIRFKIQKRQDGSIYASKIMTQRKSKNMDDGIVNFEMNQESDGTQRIMDFIPVIADLTNDNRVFVIDEIERSLHVNLVKKNLSMFYDLTNSIKSQLIATTHESALLDQVLIRKDEVWFVGNSF